MRVCDRRARDAGGGRIRYDTDDGSAFEVMPRPTDNGGYRLEYPRKVEPGEKRHGDRLRKPQKTACISVCTQAQYIHGGSYVSRSTMFLN